MRIRFPLKNFVLAAGVMLGTACNVTSDGLDGAGDGSGALSLKARAGSGASGFAGAGVAASVAGGAGVAAGIELNCTKGGAISAVHAEFNCRETTVYTCKDLSNVVLEFADGERQRFEGLNGHTNVFTGTGANAGKTVVRVWVKAGANHSGEGPGYGQRFDSSGDNCAPPAAGSGGQTGAGQGGNGGGGQGGSGEPCVVGPDDFCGPQAGTGTTGPSAGAGGNGAAGAPSEPD